MLSERNISRNEETFKFSIQMSGQEGTSERERTRAWKNKAFIGIRKAILTKKREKHSTLR